VFVPVVVGPPLGRPPSWERFAEVGADDGDGRASLDALERSLWADVDAGDPGWNDEAWRRVGAALGG
jgi:hypothetical protein